jgi:hypothetical protein
MDEMTVCSAQLEALAQHLGRAQQALYADPINAELRERVQVRFGGLIDKQQRALQELRAEASPERLPQTWRELKAIRRDCNRLFAESLAFLQGALVRTAGLDGGICQIADDLMEELRQRTDISWSRLTIPGEAALFGQLAEIIRVPFPEFTIWSLPLTGHEFGHLVAQELRVLDGDAYTFPFRELVDRAGPGGQTERFLQEYFADIFATYVHGPAYLCLAVVLRFDPVTAHVDGRDHPSGMRRVGVMLAVLELMDGGAALPLYGSVREAIGRLWERGLEATGRSARRAAALDPASVEYGWTTRIHELLESELSQARYDGWLRAQRLAQEFRPYDDPPTAQEDDTLADVLNAVWLWRLQRGDQAGDVYEAQRVDEIARQLCQDISTRRSTDA